MSLRHGYQAETNITAPRVMIKMGQFVKLSLRTGHDHSPTGHA